MLLFISTLYPTSSYLPKLIRKDRTNITLQMEVAGCSAALIAIYGTA
jgi:hypothetical protein